MSRKYSDSELYHRPDMMAVTCSVSRYRVGYKTSVIISRLDPKLSSQCGTHKISLRMSYSPRLNSDSVKSQSPEHLRCNSEQRKSCYKYCHIGDMLKKTEWIECNLLSGRLLAALEMSGIGHWTIHFITLEQDLFSKAYDTITTWSGRLGFSFVYSTLCHNHAENTRVATALLVTSATPKVVQWQTRCNTSHFAKTVYDI